MWNVGYGEADGRGEVESRVLDGGWKATRGWWAGLGCYGFVLYGLYRGIVFASLFNDDAP